MRAIVTYYVPVYVTVDLDTDTVASVVVDDQGTLDPVSVYDEDDNLITGGDAKAAIVVADTNAWPQWQVGR